MSVEVSSIDPAVVDMLGRSDFILLLLPSALAMMADPITLMPIWSQGKIAEVLKAEN